MKKRKFLMARRFLRRFNPWLFLLCVLIALIVWCVAMYTRDPEGVRNAIAAVEAQAALI